MFEHTHEQTVSPIQFPYGDGVEERRRYKAVWVGSREKEKRLIAREKIDLTKLVVLVFNLILGEKLKGRHVRGAGDWNFGEN